MNNILERYYQLVLKNKKYLEEYILNEHTENKMYDFIKKHVEESFIWMKVNSYEELGTIIHSKKAMELLNISDYYSEEICNLLEKYLKIDFQQIDYEEYETILSNDNLRKLLENVDTPKRLKDCITIERESQIVCKDMYKYIIQDKEMV